MRKWTGLLLGLCITPFIFGCVGNNSSSDNNSSNYRAYIGMPISESVCASAKFFSESDVQSNSQFGNPATCSPYVRLASGMNYLTENSVDKIMKYYYGPDANDFSKTCPKLGYLSEVPFPDNSPYVKNMKQVVEEELACVKNTLDTHKIKKPMFVFDIDDTLIAEYAGVCQYRFGKYYPGAMQAGKNASAYLPVPHIKAVLSYAFSHHIDVAFISGRPYSAFDDQRALKNLIAAYPEYQEQFTQIFDQHHLILKQASRHFPTTGVAKNVYRQSLIDQGYTIILNTGDQYSDLNYEYPYHNKPYCSYKLPNFMYYIP